MPLYLVLSLLIIAALAVAYILLKPQKTTMPQATRDTTTPAIKKDTIRLLATGDWIAHDSVNAAAKQTNGSYNY